MSVTVRQKRKGRGNPWHVFVHQNGKIRSKKVGDKRLAEAIAGKLRKKLVMGQLNLDSQEDKCPEFTAYAKHYIKDYAMTTCKRNTWRGYESIIRLHLVPAWKGKKLNEISRADAKTLLLQKQRAGYSPKTVDNIKVLVSGIFTQACEEELLQANPALRLGKYIKKQDRKKHINPLTKEQASKFLATAQCEAPEHYPLLLCAFRTGMRLGELIGLAWEDLDFEANLIEVQRSYSHGHFSTPKSHKRRFVDMSNQLKQVLLGHRMALLQEFCGKLPEYNLSEGQVHLVFPNRKGKVLCGDNFRRRTFRKLLEKADIPEIRIHDIRHTYASLLLSQGEPLNYTRDQLGHASIQTTVDVYGHIVPGSNRNAVNRLDDEGTGGLRAVKGVG